MKITKEDLFWALVLPAPVYLFLFIYLVVGPGIIGFSPNELTVKIIFANASTPIFDFRTSKGFSIPKLDLAYQQKMRYFEITQIDDSGRELESCWQIKADSNKILPPPVNAPAPAQLVQLETIKYGEVQLAGSRGCRHER